MRDPVYTDLERYDREQAIEDAYESACATRAREMVEKDPLDYIEFLGPVMHPEMNAWLVKQMQAGNLPDKIVEALVDTATEDLIYDKQHRSDWELGRGVYDIT